MLNILDVECVEKYWNFPFRDFRFFDAPDPENVIQALLAIRRLHHHEVT
jgi:hypothetical protein